MQTLQENRLTSQMMLKSFLEEIITLCPPPPSLTLQNSAEAVILNCSRYLHWDLLSPL
jgi:hypothetical protein